VPTQTGEGLDDIPVGSLPPGGGQKMEFTGMTVLKVENGLITAEIGIDDGGLPSPKNGFRNVTSAGPAVLNRREDESVSSSRPSDGSAEITLQWEANQPSE
jgi:hypothetical protein